MFSGPHLVQRFVIKEIAFHSVCGLVHLLPNKDQKLGLTIIHRKLFSTKNTRNVEPTICIIQLLLNVYIA